MQRNYRIAVLMGGVSNEREVSFKSGAAVASAFRQAGHQVFPVDIKARSAQPLDRIAPDLVFIALHGEFGEDGQVQLLLQQMGIPYTGSGPEASRLGMDKVASKRAFIRHSVPTADYLVVGGQDRDGLLARARQLGYPLVCKPACGGSSLGVSIVRSEAELPSALERAARAGVVPAGGRPAERDRRLLLERHVHGCELTVGVLDGRPLPIVEIRSKREFFNYEAKYSDEDTEYVVPVSLIESLYRKTQEAALCAYQALGCRHLARVDMVFGHDGELYVLEVNTIPGLTPRSLLPMAARYAGIEFGELCERVAAMALRDAASGRLTA